MRSFLLAVAITASLGAPAQKAINPQPFARTITAEDLKRHLFIVAGKEMEGRETATEGQRNAAVYIEEQFTALGLLPGNNGSYKQYFPVFRDSLVKASVEVNGKVFEADKDFTISLSSSYAATMLANEVVFVGYGISDSTRDDYAGVNARGKMVLILPGTPPTSGTGVRRRFNSIQETAQRNGAVAILQVQADFPRRSGPKTGGQYTNGFRTTIYPNIYTISEQIAEAIMGSDYSSAKESMKMGNHHSKSYTANVLLEFNKVIKNVASSNVIGILEGTDKKDEYVVLTAHYDHLGKRDSIIYYGADDDASGTVSLFEIAEAFAKAKAAGNGPRRSIVFMAVSGEEKGLWGSAYYADHPVFPLEKTTVDLNIDMIGRIGQDYLKDKDSVNYVYIIGDDKLSSDLTPITNQVNKNLKLKLDRKYNDLNDMNRFYYRSDHYNFAKKGVPIIFYFNGVHADYHRSTDTPDKINYPLLAKRAQLVFHTAWEMANRDEMLKRDIPLKISGR